MQSKSISSVIKRSALVSSIALGGLVACEVPALLVDFEDLVTNTYYFNTETFSSAAEGSAPVDITVGTFEFLDGSVYEDGYVQAINQSCAGSEASAQVFLNNATIAFDLGEGRVEATFEASNFGGSVNLVVNDEVASVENLEALNGIVLAGANVECSDETCNELSVAVDAEGDARLQTVAIGGQELCVDTFESDR